MRYEQQIQESFKRIGFAPRDNQVQYVNDVLVAFLDENFKNVILSAPTGTGKSIIGAVVADVVHTIKYPDTHAGASFLLTATNVLAQQYHDSFVDDDAPWDDNFAIIKGAGNYECGALSTPEEPETAESCSVVMFQKQGMHDVISRYCDVCEFKFSRTMKVKARHLITNYSYYFIDRMYADSKMAKRSVCVFDEAHLLNDLFVEHNAIYFSEKRLASYVEEVSESLRLGNTEVFRQLKLLKDHLVAGKIDDDNYKTYLRNLLNIYITISDAAGSEAQRHVHSRGQYLKLTKLAKKYKNLSCKIDDLFIFEFPHVFEYKAKDAKKGQNEHEVNVKPIFIGEMFEALDNADHNLLMSATISEQYARRTMTLPGTTKHIRLPPQFPPKNKKVIFFKPQALNYNTMKDPETIKKLCATTYQIVKHHTDLGERGIILAPSFIIVQSVAETLRVMGVKTKIFEHVRGEKLVDWLEAFKSYTNGPAVLLTPSGFEGIDLPGNLSRYQVIVKAPFASLGDRRVKVILDTFPDIYSLTALMKITQGAGRSVRSMEDYATTYMLDAGIQRLWSAKTNEWSDEFLTTYTSQLTDE
jgi:ATP-dependent DNA helicase DinG